MREERKMKQNKVHKKPHYKYYILTQQNKIRRVNQQFYDHTKCSQLIIPTHTKRENHETNKMCRKPFM